MEFCARSIGCELHTDSIELHGTFYFSCAMALRLMPRSPRRRIRLVTVADGLAVDRKPGRVENLRQLDTSNGCQDHTVLPYASAPFVLRAVRSLTDKQPCDHARVRRCRVHHNLSQRP